MESAAKILSYYCVDPQLNICFNKTVLLRERKRHTARRVASARYTALSPDRGGGYPFPGPGRGWGGGYPFPGPGRGGARGYPLPRSRWGWVGGTPFPDPGGGYSLPRSRWKGGGRGYTPPRSGKGVPPPHPNWTWEWVPVPLCPPCLDLGRGYPPPHLDLGRRYPPTYQPDGVPPPQMRTDWKYYLPPSFGCGR